jgi:hypothetical protein
MKNEKKPQVPAPQKAPKPFAPKPPVSGQPQPPKPGAGPAAPKV